MGRRIAVAIKADGVMVAGEDARTAIESKDLIDASAMEIGRVYTYVTPSWLPHVYHATREEDGRTVHRIVKRRREWEAKGWKIVARCPEEEDLPENVRAREQHCEKSRIEAEAARVLKLYLTQHRDDMIRHGLAVDAGDPASALDVKQMIADKVDGWITDLEFDVSYYEEDVCGAGTD